MHLQELVFKVCDGTEALARWHRVFQLCLRSAGCDQGDGGPALQADFIPHLLLPNMHTAATERIFIFQQELVVWKKIHFTTDFSKSVTLTRENKRKR